MNNDIDNVDILPLLDTGYVLKTITNGQNAVFRNGRLVYIILDIDKPGKYFFDLRSVFNASTGEGGKNLNIMFMNNAIPYQLNGKTIGIDGAYPSGERFHVTGSENQANSSLIEFNFPLGLFQEAGVYKFQFEIRDESGNLATSHYCFFQVTQNATLLAADWKNGVNPFDSDYTEWKNKVEQEVNALTDKLNSLNTSADQLEQLMNNYIAKAQQYVDAAWQDKLNGENTWAGKQHFNGGLTFSDNAQGDNLIVNTIGTDSLDAQAIKYHAGLLADKGNDLESGLIVHDGVVVAKADGSGQATVLNGVGNNSSNHGYISFDVFSGKDYKGVSIHANCKIPKSAIGKPLVQFSKNMGFDQTPFVLGDYIVQFNWSSNTLDCLTGTSSSPNETVMDIKTIL